jgi:hypothetical protein
MVPGMRLAQLRAHLLRADAPAGLAFPALDGTQPALPAPRASCPVATGRHGNGFLSVALPEDEVLALQREPDGTLFD